ncbi:transcription factor ABORTED MICROSPORES [Prunus yedoensis var. nudiflora]|uniref:Transcription factor ABORTED MICROSPORES n=1 Tax=Prunus yedoensis var. nudiflora TaxID=2094558 RepID=A0A314Z8P5_PRUYE|nr:transcription factor ABORTED MICROSPORES [Prunus yedoensis var. nudiflora]
MGCSSPTKVVNYCLLLLSGSILLLLITAGGMIIIMQNLTERLRPLVGLKGWDYCVIWKLSEDQRFIELMDCCCSGADENTQTNGGQELLFPVYPVLPCRDTTQHSRTNSCDVLAQLPSSLSLDSGIYAHPLISNQPIWLNSSSNRDSSAMAERDGTRVLVPSAGGLIELFVSKDVSEDEQVIDYITAQCNISEEQDILLGAGCNTSFPVNINDMRTEIQPQPFPGNENEGNDHLNSNHFQQPPVVSPSVDHDSNVPYDISVDRIRLRSSSPMNFLQHVTYNSENSMKNAGVEDQDSVKHEAQGGRTADNSGSDCSDQIDDEDDTKYRRSTGKGPQSKNLFAERKRRKKLNERLYRLRSLVPNISKMDKAAILGDAIDFVKDLLRQVKELQDELEQHSNDEGPNKKTSANNCGNHNNFQPEILNQNGTSITNKPENDDKPPNGFHVGTAGDTGNISKQQQESDGTNDRGQQMEPQVGVTQLDGNEFFVTVFCEHKPGGFVRLMEALDTLGLEVTNANVTSFRSLVSNVFKVEKKDSEVVQADDVRDSLLEITRNPSSKVWPDMAKAKASENGSGLDHFHHDDHHHYQQHHLHNYHASLQHLYNY